MSFFKKIKNLNLKNPWKLNETEIIIIKTHTQTFYLVLLLP